VLAIIIREVRDQFRLEKLRIVIGPTLFIIFLAILLFVNYFLTGKVYQTRQECFRSFFFQVAAVQFFLLIVVGTFFAAGGISTRRERLDMDFELITPRKPASIAAGCMLGSNVFVYFLFVPTVVMSMLGLLLGGVSLSTFLHVYLYLFTATLFFQTLGLFASAYSRTTTAAHIFVIVSLFVAAGLFLLHVHADKAGTLRHLGFFSPVFVLFGPWAPDRFLMPFFSATFRIEIFYVVGFFFAFFAFWFYNAAARKLADPDRPSLSRPQALVFFIIIMVLFSGFIFHKIPAGGSAAPRVLYTPVLAYLAFGLLLIVALSFILAPTRERYHAFLARYSGEERSLKRMFFHPDSMPFAFSLLLFFTGLLAFVLVFVAFGPLCGHIGGSASALVLLIGFLLVYIVASLYLAILQLIQLMTRRYGKSIALLVILGLVVLPFVLDFAFSGPAAGDGAGAGGRTGMSFVYVLNPVMVLSQAFPEVGLELANPVYIFAGKAGPALDAAAPPPGGAWQVVTGVVYLALSLILWGFVLFIRGRVKEKILLSRS
jgi:ABC-type transport system involved in multi-copper enzyme maturation permease subunit